MAQTDIYGSERKYQHRMATVEDRLSPHRRKGKGKRNKKYFIKNKVNVPYYYQLAKKLEARNTSYIRRLKLLHVLDICTWITKKDLKKLDRNDIDSIMKYAHQSRKTPESKKDFIVDIKCIWRLLFPENDEKGRPDERQIPYAVRHLSAAQDVSTQKDRSDRLTFDEYTALVTYFSDDPCTQAFITLCVESLGRPQEVLYTRIQDVQLFDNYGKITIASHGKEGTGILQCIDSFPFLSKWLNIHPLRHDKNAFLFINNHSKQLTPALVNKRLRLAMDKINKDRKITCYSLKRNGVTFARIAGASDLEIQHKARWNSTRQLKTYDKSTQEDAFKIALIKAGRIKPDEKHLMQYVPKEKKCTFCDEINGFNAVTCSKCKRPLDREEIKKQIEHASKIEEMLKQNDVMQQLMNTVQELQKRISEVEAKKQKS